ncbi:MAG TPA: hypothetical protein DCP90_04690 [Clostridiales bacterium]|nr:MAG: hypothetical protein A2Y22_06575 [Clostridiales bacterium GWD2_32_59]HAN09894.1 hypothetical protein [Clostridiales bacterium]
MEIQNLISLVGSNMFLIVSYSLIFILLSSFALRFIAKIFMFFIYIGVFVFAMSFMFSSSPDIGVNDISIGKIAKNMSNTFNDIKKTFNNGKNLITNVKNTFDINKAKSILNDSNNTLRQISDYTKTQLPKTESNSQNFFPEQQIITDENQSITITVNPNAEESKANINESLDKYNSLFNDLVNIDE